MALGLLVLLALTVDLTRVFALLAGVSPPVLLLLLAVNTAAYLLFALRWSWFCRRLGLAHSLSGRLQGVYLFQVTSQVVPSPLLGEAARFLVFPPDTRKRDIVKSIALDRLSNHIALAASVVLLLPYYLTQELPAWFRVLLPLHALIVGVLILAGRRLTPRPGSLLARLSFLRLLSSERLGLVPISLGVLLTGVLALEFQLAAQALPLSVEPPATLFLLVPALSVAISLVPISFGDWGTRELAALIVLAPTGLVSEDLVAISLLVGATNLLCSLPGLLFLARLQRPEPNSSVK